MKRERCCFCLSPVEKFEHQMDVAITGWCAPHAFTMFSSAYVSLAPCRLVSAPWEDCVYFERDDILTLPIYLSEED